MLAGAAAPTALFALGITLVGQPIRAALSELTALSLLKLIVHPALMAAVFLLWPADQPIDRLWIQLAVLFASLPIAANVFALSQFYNVYTGRTATAIMLTTICASVTVPVILFLLVTWL
jgi:predicted permease